MKLLHIFTFILATAGLLNANSYALIQESKNDFDSTLQKLLNRLEEKNMTIFAKINQAEAAKKVQKSLEPTMVVIFGNPKVGTDMMNKYPQISIDLPLKIVIFNRNQKTYVSFIRPTALAKLHHIPEETPFIKNTQKFFDALLTEITN